MGILKYAIYIYAIKVHIFMELKFINCVHNIQKKKWKKYSKLYSLFERVESSNICKIL